MAIGIISGSVTNFQVSASTSYTVPAGSNRRVFFLISSKQGSGSYALATLTLGSVSATKHCDIAYYNGQSNQASVWSIVEADIPSGSQTISGTVGSGGTLSQVYGTVVTLEDCYQGTTVSSTTIQTATGSGTPNTGVISAAFSTITSGMFMLAAHMTSDFNQGITMSGDGSHAAIATTDRNCGSLFRAAASSATAADGNETISARSNYQDASNPQVIAAIAIAQAAGGGATGNLKNNFMMMGVG